MRNNRGLSLIALIFSLAAVVPAYFLGVFLTDELLKRETQEYRVWQQSYVVDRQMYDAIAKSPPPRYHHPQEWTLRAGGGLLALILFIAVYFASRALIRAPAPEDEPDRLEKKP